MSFQKSNSYSPRPHWLKPGGDRPCCHRAAGVLECQSWATGCHLSATSWNFPAIFLLHILVAKEGSPKILLELNLGIGDTLESSIFSCTHIIHLIVKYEIGSQIFIPGDSSSANLPPLKDNSGYGLVLVVRRNLNYVGDNVEESPLNSNFCG